MITTTNLNFTYNNETSFEFPDITIESGKHLLILGESGVGKTTLLNILSGLLPPQKGSVTINKTEINTLSRDQMDRFRGEHIGLIFQKYCFIKSLSVSENLKLRQSFPKQMDDPTRRIEISKRLGLSPLLNKKVTTLSQGQQQRLSIALGLIHKPKVIFADEPTSNLDDTNCNKVIQLLKEEAKICHSSLVIITHDARVKSHFDNQIIL